MSKKAKKITSLLLLVLFVFSIAGTAFALEEPKPVPDAYYGTAKLNGQDAPVGSIITAKIDNVVVGSITVEQAGKYGQEGALGAKLLVKANSNSDIGKTVTFEIDGVVCDQTVTFKSGVVSVLNLTATGTPTQIDKENPYVVSTDPANNAKDIEPSINTITVTFNEDIEQDVDFNNITLSNGSAQVSVGKSVSSKSLIITINNALEYNKTYTLTIPKTAIKDLSKNNLLNDFALTFTTKANPPDTKAPSVLSTSVSNNSTGVSINTKSIQINFDEIIINQVYSTISLLDNSNNSINISSEINGQTLVIKINGTLNYSTQYTLTVPKDAIKDLAGNILSNDIIIKFTTEQQSTNGSGGGSGGVVIIGGGGSSTTTNPTNNDNNSAPADNNTNNGNQTEEKDTYKIDTSKENNIKVSNNLIINISPKSLNGENISIKATIISAPSITELLGKKIANTPYEIVVQNATLTSPYSVTVNLLTSKVAKTDVIEVYVIDKSGNVKKVTSKVNVNLNTVTFDLSELDAKIVVAAAPVDKMFKDVASSWAKQNIAFMASRGIITGYSDNTFKPKKSVTRAEIAVMLSRMLQVKAEKDNTKDFADNKAIPSWAKDAISACVELGILNGSKSSDGTISFKSDKSMTRVELASVLARILKKYKEGITTQELNFADNAKIPSWAQEDLGIAVKYGIIKGYSDNTFKPTNSVTREEASAMIMRLIEQLEK